MQKRIRHLIIELVSFSVIIKTAEISLIETTPTLTTAPPLDPDQCPDEDGMKKCRDDCEDGHWDCLSGCGSNECNTKCAQERNRCLYGCYGWYVACFCTDPPSQEDLLNTDRCMKKWGSILGDCIVDCNAIPDCEAECIDDYKENIEYCPCESRCPKGCPCPHTDMYECIELPEQPIATSTSSIPRTSTTTADTSSTTHLASTVNYTSSSIDQNWNWRDGIDQNDLKVLRMLSILEFFIAIVLIGEYTITFLIYHAILITTTLNPMLGLISLYKEVTDEWDGWSIFYSYICFTITLFAMFGMSILISLLRLCCRIDDGFFALFLKSPDQTDTSTSGTSTANMSNQASTIPVAANLATATSNAASPDPPSPGTTAQSTASAATSPGASTTTVTETQSTTPVERTSSTSTPAETPTEPPAVTATETPTETPTEIPGPSSESTTQVSPAEVKTSQIHKLGVFCEGSHLIFPLMSFCAVVMITPYLCTILYGSYYAFEYH